MASQLIHNRFLVLRTLGEGAAGSVFETSLVKEMPYAPRGSRIAVKVYKPWVLSERNQGYRIEQELRAGLEVSCPNVVKTFEVGTHGDTMYLAMEFLSGISLREWISLNRHPTFCEVVEVLSGIVRGLHALHAHGLIHRDIKPENIMITPRGSVILDLGVLRNITRDTVITGLEFLGTLAYAAPEYLFGTSYDATIDAYSFGLIVFEIALGKPLIESTTYWSRAIIEKAHPPWTGQNYFEHTALSNLKLTEKAFLKALIDGCVFVSHRDYETVRCNPNLMPPRRFTSEQLNAAFSGRVWESTFSYPVPFFGIERWPRVSEDIEAEVTRFAPVHLDVMPSRCPEILWKAAYYNDGSFYELRKEWQPREEAAVFECMRNAGLILDKVDDDDGHVEWISITQLAWQLLLRAIIKYSGQQKDEGNALE